MAQVFIPAEQVHQKARQVPQKPSSQFGHAEPAAGTGPRSNHGDVFMIQLVNLNENAPMA
jgi:hypothetical protein